MLTVEGTVMFDKNRDGLLEFLLDYLEGLGILGGSAKHLDSTLEESGD
jgi:hypothetical protein